MLARRHQEYDAMALSDSLLTAITTHLTHELDDATTARQLAEILRDDALTWHARTIEPKRITTILGFTFGNRVLANGNRLPGPVNEALADMAVRLHGQSGARIIAQWEVAEAIGARVPAQLVSPIHPARDERAEPRYLSTSGVIEAVVRQAGDPAVLGVVGIVAFADHARRCTDTARRFGLDASVPAGYALPRDYDAQSGQPWCRNRLAYLMHDLAIAAAERRDHLA
jgi:hypothetical protein